MIILFCSIENDDPVYFSYFLIDPKKGEIELAFVHLRMVYGTLKDLSIDCVRMQHLGSLSKLTVCNDLHLMNYSVATPNRV